MSMTEQDAALGAWRIAAGDERAECLTQNGMASIAPAMTMIARRIFFRRCRVERPRSRRLRGVACAAARARDRA